MQKSRLRLGRILPTDPYWQVDLCAGKPQTSEDREGSRDQCIRGRVQDLVNGNPDPHES